MVLKRQQIWKLSSYKYIIQVLHVFAVFPALRDTFSLWHHAVTVHQWRFYHDSAVNSCVCNWEQVQESLRWWETTGAHVETLALLSVIRWKSNCFTSCCVKMICLTCMQQQWSDVLQQECCRGSSQLAHKGAKDI